MSKHIKLNPEGSETEDTSQAIILEEDTLISFNDLIVDESLSPVKIEITSERKKLPSLTDELLIELQCEV